MSNTTVNKIGERLDFLLKAGGKFNQSIIFTDSNDVPIDLTFYDLIRFQCRKKPTTDIIMHASTEDSSITITGDGNNILNIVGVDIPNIPGKYKYDLDFVKGDTINDSYFYGMIIITSQISEDVSS